MSARFDLKAGRLMTKARFDNANKNASPKARELAEFTGIIAKDIDAMLSYTASRNLIIVARLPDFHANAFSEEIIAGTAIPKPAGPGLGKSGPYGYNKDEKRNLLVVSDNDLMCMHQLDNKKGIYEPIESNWNGIQPMNNIERDYIGNLNNRLISKIQHGFNDCYIDKNTGKSLNSDIGSEFAFIKEGSMEIIYTVPSLQAVYNKEDLSGFNPDYLDTPAQVVSPPQSESGKKSE